MEEVLIPFTGEMQVSNTGLVLSASKVSKTKYCKIVGFFFFELSLQLYNPIISLLFLFSCYKIADNLKPEIKFGPSK